MLHFWITEFYLRKSFLTNKRFLKFKYFNGYGWKSLKIFLSLSYNEDITFYTNLIVNSVTEDLNKTKNGLEEYRKIIPFIEQLNVSVFDKAKKIGR